MYGGWLVNREVWITIIAFAVGLTLMMFRTLDALKFASTIGVLATIYVVVLIGLFWTNQFTPTLDPCDHSTLKQCPGTTKMGLDGAYGDGLKVLSIYAFAYSVAYNIPALVNELDNNTHARLDGVIWSSIGVVTCMYIATAIFGYYSFGDGVEADILKIFPKNTWSIVARIALSANVMTGFPLQMHPTKNGISEIIFGKEASLLSRSKYIPLVLGIFALSWIGALVIPSLDIVLAFVGATTCNLIGYVLPCIFYLRIYKKQNCVNQLIASFIIAFGVLLIPACITAEILSLTGAI